MEQDSNSALPHKMSFGETISFTLAFSYIVAILYIVQYHTDLLIDRDSYYHVRYANLLPEHGLSSSFPWTQYSTWRDSFSDKEFSFHIYLMPFCLGEANMVAGGKLAVLILAVVIFYIFYHLLIANAVRVPWLWLILLLSAGNHWLFRIQEVRPHLLSILLTLISVHCILQHKYKWLFAVGWIYAWSYSAPQMLVGLALLDMIAVYLRERRIYLQGVIASLGGVVAGLVINPYFPNSLYNWYIVNIRVLAFAWGGIGGEGWLLLGSELDPVSTRSFLTEATVVFIVLAVGICTAIFSKSKVSRATASLLFMSGGCFVLYCLSAKFIEYLAPVAIWMCAFSVTDAIAVRKWSEILPKMALSRIAVVILLATLVVYLHIISISKTIQTIEKFPSPNLEGVAKWLEKNVPAGETIGHLNWSDFTQLYHFDPAHYYIVGLDPMFMYVKYPDKSKHLEEVRLGRTELIGEDFASTFDTKYLVINKERRSQYERARRSGLKIAYEDGGGAVVILRE